MTNGEGRPANDRTAQELSAAQGSSSLELYYQELERRAGDDPSRCSICGRPDDNLSRPFGRCWTCIGGQAGQPPLQRPLSSSPDDGQPLWVRVLWPDDDRPRFLQELRPRGGPQLGQPTVPASGDVGRRLTGLLTHLNGAVEGTRNATLFWTAARVGEMVVAGELHDPGRAADALTDVAVAIGLTPSEAAGTIRSGLRRYGVVA